MVLLTMGGSVAVRDTWMGLADLSGSDGMMILLQSGYIGLGRIVVVYLHWGDRDILHMIESNRSYRRFMAYDA
jgi:hypothetical protein